MTWAETFKYLADNNVLFEGILLKPSMVTPGAEHKKKATPEEVRCPRRAALCAWLAAHAPRALGARAPALMQPPPTRMPAHARSLSPHYPALPASRRSRPTP